jgi:hypothetical protein
MYGSGAFVCRTPDSYEHYCMHGRACEEDLKARFQNLPGYSACHSSGRKETSWASGGYFDIYVDATSFATVLKVFQDITGFTEHKPYKFDSTTSYQTLTSPAFYYPIAAHMT